MIRFEVKMVHGKNKCLMLVVNCNFCFMCRLAVICYTKPVV